ncbi:hypothetical protein [Streptomyces angustmyceticus]|uniref:hypothetical protein n=1 Tax=Streptomyces angustmyceticus TaxID=285578 RepID=UPI003D94008C
MDVLNRAGVERPDAPVRYITLRQSIRPASGGDRGARDTAGRFYSHQWFVRPGWTDDELQLVTRIYAGRRGSDA